MTNIPWEISLQKNKAVKPQTMVEKSAIQNINIGFYTSLA